MSRALAAMASVAALLLSAAPAAAQTAGRASIGIGHTWIRPAHEEVSPTSGFGPIARLNPGRGLGLAAALDWFDADVQDAQGHAGVIRVRPFMAGVGLGIPQGRLPHCTGGGGRTLVQPFHHRASRR